MKNYKWSVYITCFLSAFSFIFAYWLNINNTDIFLNNTDIFLSNVFIGVFSSSTLVFITSIIGYRIERRQTLEDIWHYSEKTIYALNQYDSLRYNSNITVKQKAQFFIDNVCDKDLYEWEKQYRNICFLFDYKNKTRLYIFNNLYKPFLLLKKQILDLGLYGLNKNLLNEKEIKTIVEIIESKIYRTEIKGIKTVTYIELVKTTCCMAHIMK